MVRDSFSRLRRAITVAGTICLLTGITGAAQAQFLPVASAGTIDFALYDLVPGGAAPFFAPSGQMLQAGGNYPTLNNRLNFSQWNGPLFNGLAWSRPSDVGPVLPLNNFGGGAAIMGALSNGGAGIYSPYFRVSDRGFAGIPGAGATAAVLTMTGSARYQYLGPQRLFSSGVYLGMTAIRKPIATSFVEAGLFGIITVTPPVGLPFFTFSSLTFGYDGIAGDINPGPRGDFVNAGASIVAHPAPNRVTFQAISRGLNLLIPTGSIVDMSIGFTLVGDPASVEFLDFPNDPLLGPLPDLSPGGAASNIVGAAPEPGSVALMLFGGSGFFTLVWRRARIRPKSLRTA